MLKKMTPPCVDARPRTRPPDFGGGFGLGGAEGRVRETVKITLGLGPVTGSVINASIYPGG